MVVANEQRGTTTENCRLKTCSRVDQRTRQATDGNRVQAEDPVADREHGDHEHLAVGLADVLREHRGGLGWDPNLWALGQLHARFPDKGNTEAGNAVGAGWGGGGHGMCSAGGGGGGLPPPPPVRPPGGARPPPVTPPGSTPQA